jgi:UDP-galactopyranose mutase
MISKKEIGIAGAGFAGAVLARELAMSGRYDVVVFDVRGHVAGNCHTLRDASTGVMVHEFGPHIFHTSREDVWDYVNRFGNFMPFINRVKAVTARGLFTLPINLLTINQFFGKTLAPSEAREFVASLGDAGIAEPRSFEEQALKFLGRELYENFFYGYTKKQWGVEPRELPASILQRLPVRFNYDDNYYASRWQGIPAEGYTEVVSRILDHPGIKLRLGERFDPAYRSEFHHVFYSGPMDAWFEYELGRLQYRSLVFDRFEAPGDVQGNAVMNSCEETVPWTRVTEHKHFAPWEEHARSVCFRERSKLAGPSDTPYYPLRLENDKRALGAYAARAESEEGVTFIGRLGTYRYLDMHVVIGESLDLARICLASDDASTWPRFAKPPV